MKYIYHYWLFQTIRLLPFPQSFNAQSPTAIQQLVQQVWVKLRACSLWQYSEALQKSLYKYESKTDPGCMTCFVFLQQHISNVYKLHVDLIIRYYMMVLETVTLVMLQETGLQRNQKSQNGQLACLSKQIHTD